MIEHEPCRSVAPALIGADFGRNQPAPGGDAVIAAIMAARCYEPAPTAAGRPSSRAGHVVRVAATSGLFVVALCAAAMLGALLYDDSAASKCPAPVKSAIAGGPG